jgi:hypothetical protein
VIGQKKRISAHKRLNFPQEQSARRSRVEESNEPAYQREFIPEPSSQWCPRGLTRSWKRRVQRLTQCKQLELEAEAAKIWRPKEKADKSELLADINMVFFLPAEYRNQADEEDQEETSAHLVLHPQKARFDKPGGEKRRHLKALYLSGFVDEMLVHGGATVNLMPPPPESQRPPTHGGHHHIWCCRQSWKSPP